MKILLEGGIDESVGFIGEGWPLSYIVGFSAPGMILSISIGRRGVTIQVVIL